MRHCSVTASEVSAALFFPAFEQMYIYSTFRPIAQLSEIHDSDWSTIQIS